MLRTRVVTSDSGLQELKGAWQALQTDAPKATPFQTWEWQSTWFKHFGGAKRPHLFTLLEGDDLVGIMPLVQSRGPWRVLRAMGSGPSDVLQPLAREGFEAKVSQEFAVYLNELDSADVVDLHQVREDSPLGLAFPDAITQATCLLLDLPPTYDAFLGTLSKSLRYDCKRMDKSGFKEAGCQILDVPVEDVQAGMDWLFDTHRRRWRKRGLPGAFVGKKIQAFQREWASLAAIHGWLWLATMSQNGTPVGALYGMRMGGTCYYYQAGFDPEFKAMSPGTLLVAHSIRRAISEGLTTFDFVRGDESYKRRWKPQRTVLNKRILINRGGVLGTVGEAWNKAGFRLETKVRGRLEGGSLIKS